MNDLIIKTHVLNYDFIVELFSILIRFFVLRKQQNQFAMIFEKNVCELSPLALDVKAKLDHECAR